MSLLTTKGALDGGGGGPMSHVDFKKCQCRMSLSLNTSPVPCRIEEMSMSHVTIFFEPMLISISGMSPCRI